MADAMYDYALEKEMMYRLLRDDLARVVCKVRWHGLLELDSWLRHVC